MPTSQSQVGSAGIFLNNELHKHHNNDSGKHLNLLDKNKQQLALRHF